MIRKFLYQFFSAVVLVVINFSLAVPTVLAAGDKTPGIVQLQDLFGRVLQVAGAGVFIALTVMLVVAGIKFLTSGGEPKSIQNASLTVTWAILGIVFLVLAWLFLLLIEKFTGAPVTKFNLLDPKIFPQP